MDRRVSNRKTTTPAKKAPAAKVAGGPGSDDDFTYDSPAGPIAVPSLSRVKAGVIRKARNLAPADQMFTLIEAVCDAGTLELVDELTGAELNDFMEGWVEHSGVSLGE